MVGSKSIRTAILRLVSKLIRLGGNTSAMVEGGRVGFSMVYLLCQRRKLAFQALGSMIC